MVIFLHELKVMVTVPPDARVVRLEAVCFEPLRLCLVMPLMERGSVWDVISMPGNAANVPEEWHAHLDGSGSLPWVFRLDLAHKCAVRLNALHSCHPPIVHRDIKAANFLVSRGWEIFMGDLAFSTTLDEAPATSGSFARLTGGRFECSSLSCMLCRGQVAWDARVDCAGVLFRPQRVDCDRRVQLRRFDVRDWHWQEAVRWHDRAGDQSVPEEGTYR